MVRRRASTTGPPFTFDLGLVLVAIVLSMAKGRIPESDIQAIRERTPIEDIVGEYVQLRPAGADSLKGLSPFKDEKTPSFHVRPNHGYFHCFSTGKGGDVFTFLMEIEHVSFPEAVEMCAEHIGYRINYQGGTTGARNELSGTRKRLIEANRTAHEFYRAQLETPSAAVARQFLLDRGFSRDLIHSFECGYAPEGWDTLTKHLLRRGFEYKELEDAGLSKMGRRGPIDRFHRRLLWPIKDISGNVIGFGARKLFDDDNLGKYMNTPETMLYKKSKVLFGLDMAKKDIATRHQAVVVEGYTDVMAMHAAGITTAVASCGTAFGEDHLQLIRRLMLDDSYFRGELIYTFDGDEAGQKAALRAFEGEQKFIGQSFVSVAPNGLDPCDLRLQRGDAAVRDLVADRVPMFEFVIRSLISNYNLDTPEGRLQALRRTAPVVAQIKDKPLQDEYARLLAGWVGWLDPADVLLEVQRAARAPKRDQMPRRSTKSQGQQGVAQKMLSMPDRKDPRLWSEREVLKLALQTPEYASKIDELGEEYFSHETYRALRKAITEAGGCTGNSEGVDWIAKVQSKVHDIVATSVLSELAVEPIRFSDEDFGEHIQSTFARLQERYVGNEIARVKSQMERMRPSEDVAVYNRLFAELVQLEKLRKSLLTQAFR